MFDLTKILPEYIVRVLPKNEQRLLARTYIITLVISLLIGAILMTGSFIGKNLFCKGQEWAVFEFGRYNQKCRLGEMIFTSTVSPNEKYEYPVKWVAGYANRNEKYWIDLGNTSDEIRLLSYDGIQQIYKLSDDKTIYLLQEIVKSDGTKSAGKSEHYLSKMYKPSLLGGLVENSRYLYSSTCDGFQSRD